MRNRLVFLALLFVCVSLAFSAQEQVARDWSSTLVTMSAKDRGLVEVVEELVSYADRRVAVEQGIDTRSPVTVELRAVPWDQALEQVAQVNGLEARVVGDLVVLSESRGRPGLSRWQQER